jgi:hypothetical protein
MINYSRKAEKIQPSLLRVRAGVLITFNRTKVARYEMVYKALVIDYKYKSVVDREAKLK